MVQQSLKVEYIEVHTHTVHWVYNLQALQIGISDRDAPVRGFNECHESPYSKLSPQMGPIFVYRICSGEGLGCSRRGEAFRPPAARPLGCLFFWPSRAPGLC